MKPSKILIAPDSYKGTLSSEQVCGIISEVARKHFPDCEIVDVPIADGGEGSVDCFLRCLHGEKIPVVVKNPFMEDMHSFYGLLDNNLAVVEMAACAGLPLAEGRLDPMSTTTFGVGQLINDAVTKGARKIIVALGGSATNDGGCGAAAACGAVFFNKYGKEFIPTGGTLKDIENIEVSNINPLFRNTCFTVMSDIDNPMFGPHGAAYVFGPQKGAGADDITVLDDGLRHLSSIIKKDLGVDVALTPGSGAAGGMGAGMIAFFGAGLRSGIDVVLDTAGFDNHLDGADLVITGEGRFDRQSLRGKAVIGIARRAKRYKVPVILITGGTEDMPEAFDLGIHAILSINRLPEDLQVSHIKSADNLRLTADNLFRLIAL